MIKRLFCQILVLMLLEFEVYGVDWIFLVKVMNDLDIYEKCMNDFNLVVYNVYNFIVKIGQIDFIFCFGRGCKVDIYLFKIEVFCIFRIRLVFENIFYIWWLKGLFKRCK